MPTLVGGFVLAGGSSAQADLGSQDSQSTPPYSDGLYVVQLADQPVATSPKTAPEQGERLDTGTGAVREYLRHLRKERDKVLDAVQGVKPSYTYQYALNGFSAQLTAHQATKLAHTPGVVSVSPNRVSHPAATAAADSAAEEGTAAPADTAKFLGLKDKGGLYSEVPGGQRNAGAGMIIGDLDTGINTDNPSLKPLENPTDQKIIDKKWKGSCDAGDDPAHPVTCNNKVIGAQYFDSGLTKRTEDDWASPRDAESHGTHTATTAAGDADVPASVPGTGISGSISGLAPAARIAAYKVCWSSGCYTSDIVAGFDKAVADGVDVINYSIGGSNAAPANTPEYMAMFNAAKAGVFVSAAAGNEGPNTATNGVPWVTTVAASTHDVGYRATLTLGDGTTYDGVSIATTGLPSAPLVDAAKAAKSGVDAATAGQCQPDSLDPDKVKGAIVLCARGGNDRIDKSAQVKAAGGVGMVLYNVDAGDDELPDAHTIPSVHVDKADGEAIKAYADGSGATAELGAPRSVREEAPQVAGFSSSGPDLNSGGDLLKPDIAAPGVNVVAGSAAHGEYPGEQAMMSGTSMATPHVSGLALILRQLHPDWSPMEVKSALMTTATTDDNEGQPIQRSASAATPLDYGAGEAVPNSAADPGLVYDSTSADWTSYLCAIGQPPVTDDGSDPCPTAGKTDPSDLNTASISVGDLSGVQTVTRRVTNVSDELGVYRITPEAPDGYEATVSPRTLTVLPGASATYKVTFTRTDAPYDDFRYGSVVLRDGEHEVRSPVALRAVPIQAPDEVTAAAADGSVTLTPKVGFDGTLTTAMYGLYASKNDTGTLTGTAKNVDPSHLTDATAKIDFTVPEGTTFARVSIRSADYAAGSDIDLMVLDKDGKQVSPPATDGSDEHADLRPGTYTVYVDQYALPEGVTSQKFTLYTWTVGPDTKVDRPVTVDPAEKQVVKGESPAITLSWSDLKADTAYLGVVHYDQDSVPVDTTTLTVTP